MKIPIAALKSLATIYRQQHVIVFSQGQGTQHIATYGDTVEHCSEAADLGNKMKVGLGWPKSLQAQPARVKALQKRLARIKELIEAVEQRCLAVDGPVSKTCDEITDADLKEIYRLAGGKPV